jgi:hypothetical protein
VAAFDGGNITSDGGCVLLREIDERVGVIAAVNRTFVDSRDPAKIRHQQFDLMRQRVMAISVLNPHRLNYSNGNPDAQNCSNAHPHSPFVND